MRKQPRQARSRATVDAIVQAGTRVLGGKGWAGFNTNEVAEVAGVSIGSLYQYFPDKLSLVDAIRHRHFEEVQQVVNAAGQRGLSLARRLEGLVRGMIEVHHSNPALHRALLDEVPSLKGVESAHTVFEEEYLRGYQAVVAAIRPRSRRKTIEAAAQVISSAIEGVIHDAARRGTLGSTTLRRELLDLVRAYLEALKEHR
jgi:AcrR family transcriptional regulator